MNKKETIVMNTRTKKTIILILSLILFSCGGSYDQETDYQSSPTKRHIVKYCIYTSSGTGTADVTYYLPTHQVVRKNVEIPWTFVFQATNKDYFFIAAENIKNHDSPNDHTAAVFIANDDCTIDYIFCDPNDNLDFCYAQGTL
jgi:hypothetical protein